MTVVSDVQKLEPGKLIDLFVLDASPIGGQVAYLYPGMSISDQPIFWQGYAYEPFPMEVEGFERSTRGPTPRPKVRVANVTGLISALCIAYRDLIGARVVRKRTFARYLDAGNFGGVNPTADPNAHWPDEVYFVDRKAGEDKLMVEFDLAAAWDIDNVMLPRRQIIANLCTFRYRGADCGYAGAPVATAADAPTSSAALDVCGKRLTSCTLRWGANAELPFGGFPGAGLVR